MNLRSFLCSRFKLKFDPSFILCSRSILTSESKSNLSFNATSKLTSNLIPCLSSILILNLSLNSKLVVVSVWFQVSTHLNFELEIKINHEIKFELRFDLKFEAKIHFEHVLHFGPNVDLKFKLSFICTLSGTEELELLSVKLEGVDCMRQPRETGEQHFHVSSSDVYCSIIIQFCLPLNSPVLPITTRAHALGVTGGDSRREKAGVDGMTRNGSTCVTAQWSFARCLVFPQPHTCSLHVMDTQVAGLQRAPTRKLSFLFTRLLRHSK